MKYNPTLITNIGLVAFFVTLLVDKMQINADVSITKALYIISALFVLFGTIGYFVRKR